MTVQPEVGHRGGGVPVLVGIATAVTKEATAMALEPPVRDLLTAHDAQLERLEALHEDVRVLVPPG